MATDTPNAADSSAAQQHWQLVAKGDWLAGQRFTIVGQAVLGRDSGCDITIPGKHLSRRHARLTVHGNTLRVTDLGSANGSFVNEQRIQEAELFPGDEIRFDVLVFTVVGPVALDDNATRIRPVPAKIRSAAPVKQTSGERRWKTRPTSVGNRDKTVQVSIAKKTALSLWRFVAVAGALVVLALLGFLFSQL